MQTALASDLVRVERRDRALSELEDIEALVRTHRARLLRFVTFSVGDADTAASIVQDCFLRAYSKRSDFRGDSSVATWLTTIAVNLVRDHQRLRKLRFWQKAGKSAVDIMEMASILPGGQSSPEHQLLAREKAAAVGEAMQTLSVNQRTVFFMRFYEEADLGDIALTLGMPLNTVKTHLHRALRNVREQVGSAR